MRCISILRSLYFKIFSASFLIIFLSPDRAKGKNACSYTGSLHIFKALCAATLHLLCLDCMVRIVPRLEGGRSRRRGSIPGKGKSSSSHSPSRCWGFPSLLFSGYRM
jgi:hypothetical protein